MKIIIVSDSHFDRDMITKIYNRHQHETTTFLHCGDSQLLATDQALAPYIVVRGNCDLDINYDLEQTLTLENGAKLMITHGHVYDVKYSMQRLNYKALEVGARIVCFGHTHEIACELVEDVLFVNPGSVLLPRNTRERTYATLNIVNNQIDVTFLEAPTGQILYEKQFII